MDYLPGFQPLIQQNSASAQRLTFTDFVKPNDVQDCVELTESLRRIQVRAPNIFTPVHTL